MSIIAWDIDDVICSRKAPPHIENQIGPDKYAFCQPNQDQIDIINAAFEDGHIIILYTSRGMSQYNGDAEMCSKELRPVTEKMLNKWGVKYNSLVFGKIYFDLIIDNKAINSTYINSLSDLQSALVQVSG